MRYLNGWQKLWIAASLLYAIPITLAAVAEWSSGTPSTDWSQFTPIERSSPPPMAPGSVDWSQFRPIERPPGAELENSPGRNSPRRAPTEHLLILATAFVAWVVPVAGIYALGIGAGRVATMLRSRNAFSPVKVQRYIFGVAAVLCLLMLLFPPFHFEYGDVTHNLGYGFLFNPPRLGPTDRSAGFVTISTLAAQCIGVLIIAALAVLMTKRPE